MGADDGQGAGLVCGGGGHPVEVLDGAGGDARASQGRFPAHVRVGFEEAAPGAPEDKGVTVSFVAYGTPAPQGSKKAVGRAKSGRTILVESSAKVKPWRQDVKAAAEKVRDTVGEIMDGPLAVSMTFTLIKPSSAPKRRQTWPDRMPDLSKLIRSTEDAITDAGLWADDARIVECTAAKRYPGEGRDALNRPGVVVVIRPIDPSILFDRAVTM